MGGECALGERKCDHSDSLCLFTCCPLSSWEESSACCCCHCSVGCATIRMIISWCTYTHWIHFSGLKKTLQGLLLSSKRFYSFGNMMYWYMITSWQCWKIQAYNLILHWVWWIFLCNLCSPDENLHVSTRCRSLFFWQLGFFIAVV